MSKIVCNMASAVLLGILLYSFMVFCTGYAMSTRNSQRQAVKNGFGEYDRTTGEFRMYTAEEVRGARK